MFNMGKHKLAEDSLLEGLQISKAVGIPEAIGRALFGLAQISLLNGDIEAAREKGERSLSIFEKANAFKAAKNRRWLALLPS